MSYNGAVTCSILEAGFENILHFFKKTIIIEYRIRNKLGKNILKPRLLKQV